MLAKLSFRNAKRQAKDYTIYFITIVLAVALMFSFHSIAVSEDIENLSQMMNYFSKTILVISMIIMVVMAWLINYTMKFMLEKRSKEFGTYQILGIEKKDISNIFTLENLIIGVFAFFVGIAGGTLLYQVFTSIIMKIFGQPYEIAIEFKIEAVGITAMYFFGIFLLVLWNNRRKIKKTKVYDLLYADKQNENNKIKNPKGNLFFFVISLVLLVCAYGINAKEFQDPNTMNGRNMMLAVLLLIVGIYLFYFSLSSFIVKQYLEKPKRKYRKDNLFLYRNLTSKINTMSLTMGTIAMLFTFIFIGGNVALLLNQLLNNEIDMGYPFEVMVSSEEEDLSKYQTYIEENSDVTDIYQYKLYQVPETGVYHALDGTSFEGRYEEGMDSVIGLSDYNRLREILGLEKVSLQSNEAIIQCMKTTETYFEAYRKQNQRMEIRGETLTIKEVKGDNFGQIYFNGYTYCLVVSDDLFNQIAEKNEQGDSEIGLQYKMIAQTKETTSEDFYNGLFDLIPTRIVKKTVEVNGEQEEYEMEIYLGDVSTRGKRESETKSFFTIISFLAFYIALICMMAATTLLAIQQLSDSEKYKYRYQTLKKIGMDELATNQIILKQLLIYFGLPILLPLFLSIPITLSVANIFQIAVTLLEIWKIIGMTTGFVLLVYMIYFIATDIQFERNVNGG